MVQPLLLDFRLALSQELAQDERLLHYSLSLNSILESMELSFAVLAMGLKRQAIQVPRLE